MVVSNVISRTVTQRVSKSADRPTCSVNYATIINKGNSARFPRPQTDPSESIWSSHVKSSTPSPAPAVRVEMPVKTGLKPPTAPAEIFGGALRDLTPPPPGAHELARMALDNMAAIVAYWDADQRCRFVNRAVKRWLGVDPEALIGKHYSELLGPLYVLNRPNIEAALRGEPQEFEREIPDSAGGPPKQVLAHYLPDVVDGAVRGFFVLATDVSTIKRSEAALRESEERFRLTLEEAPIGMAVVGTDGRFLRVNGALCAILGYPAQELVGMTFQSVTHPEDLDADLALAGQLARGEIPRYSLEKRYIRKDGHVVEVELSGSVLRNPDGQPLHFIAQVEDISTRKRREREQAFLADLGPVLAFPLDAPDIFERIAALVTRRIADFCIVDLVRDGKVLRKAVASRNPSMRAVAEALWHLPLDVERPTLMSEAVRTQQPVLVQRVDLEALPSMTPSAEDICIVERLQMQSLVTVPMVASGRLLGVIALIASEGSREYDAGDLRLAQQLASRAATALENASLYRIARDATKVRDEVLGIVAHDLRNPLSTIAAHAALLGHREKLPAGSQANAHEAIQRAVARMARLIDDLLDVSSMEAGRLSVEQKPLDARTFLFDCVESQRKLADAASIELRLQAPGLMPPVRADRDRLLQVFENLVGNALKFTPSGGQVTVAADVLNDEVLFSVRDNGAGIATEHLAHLFDRFWQARRAERQGAGLGLPIAKGVVEAHGGRIWVNSTPGKGSCFFFTIPRADTPIEVARGNVTSKPLDAGSGFDLGGFLADDDGRSLSAFPRGT
jgi:PAS domain S-box-containing protein